MLTVFIVQEMTRRPRAQQSLTACCSTRQLLAACKLSQLHYLLRFVPQQIIHRLQRLVFEELQIVPAAFLQPRHKLGVPLLQAVLNIEEEQVACASFVGWD